MKLEIDIDLDPWDLTYALSQRFFEHPECVAVFINENRKSINQALMDYVNSKLKDEIDKLIRDTIQNQVRQEVENYLNCRVYGCTLQSAVNKHLDLVLEDHIKSMVNQKLKQITDKFLQES